VAVAGAGKEVVLMDGVGTVTVRTAVGVTCR
jgi:hypothetical protein